MDMNKSQLYAEVCSSIRQTDTISAALLGFVPLISGSAIIMLLLTKNDIEPLFLIIFSLLGLMVTFGLYLWEKRNIDSCRQLREVAIELEQCFSKELQPLTNIKNTTPTLFGVLASKTRAEKIIYGSALLAWFVPLLKGIYLIYP